MKKALLTLAVAGTIFLTACEKDEVVQPVSETSIKTDKGLACRGCGQWDIANPQNKSLATYDGAPATSVIASTSSIKK